MPLVSLLAAVAFLTLVGCTDASAIRDHFQRSEYRLSLEQRLRFEAAAAVVVVGHVLRVKKVGRPGDSPGDPRVKTQLTQITIDVEEVIKGEPLMDTLDFYYFVYSDENDKDLGVPRYVPEVGQRRIYFLSRSGDTYRSVGDVTNYSLAVRSGSHGRGYCRGKQPGCCIAEILLVPGNGTNVQAFVDDLGPYSAYAAGTLCSPEKALELIQRLTHNSDVKIADAASQLMPELKQWWPQLR